ncbi:MAG: hypothetical protein AAGC99_12255 [Pseudomonadota bacterium]
MPRKLILAPILGLSLLAGCAKAPIDEFREDLTQMDQRAQLVAGLSLFEDAELAEDGSVKVMATEVWNAIPEEGRISYANALFLRWQAAAIGLEPLSLQIVDPAGNVVMERPDPS